MSYENPTPHEIRISANLQKVAKRLDKDLEKRTGHRCHFILCVTPIRSDEEADTLLEEPIANYVANSDRQTSALIMLQLLAKWQMNGDMPPIHELRDADGKSLADILSAGTH